MGGARSLRRLHQVQACARPGWERLIVPQSVLECAGKAQRRRRFGCDGILCRATPKRGRASLAPALQDAIAPASGLRISARFWSASAPAALSWQTADTFRGDVGTTP